MSPQEMDMLKNLVADNPEIRVTPTIMLQFIAEKTRHSPPSHSNESFNGFGADEDDMTLHNSSFTRGREDELEVEDLMFGRRRSHSRSSSNGSSHAISRPPSRGAPQTPAKSPSIFDTTRRQRSTPLVNNAPSSWSTKRPTPAKRRKSDAGSRSDSEVRHTALCVRHAFVSNQRNYPSLFPTRQQPFARRGPTRIPEHHRIQRHLTCRSRLPNQA